ncbi:hypothetical protein [Nonomuraea sp. NPDC049400]|uniref:hypothetical protein n=1 Tax=Nonomuraea sp. NPDC049400 TaxID=3364352 RepID=UPI0037A892D2
MEMRHLAGRGAWGDPLVMILKETLMGRLEWRETEARLIVEALAGAVPAVLGEWERDNTISVEQAVKTARQLCSVILSSAEAIQIAARMEAATACNSPPSLNRALAEWCFSGTPPRG